MLAQVLLKGCAKRLYIAGAGTNSGGVDRNLNGRNDVRKVSHADLNTSTSPKRRISYSGEIFHIKLFRVGTGNICFGTAKSKEKREEKACVSVLVNGLGELSLLLIFDSASCRCRQFTCVVRYHCQALVLEL